MDHSWCDRGIILFLSADSICIKNESLRIITVQIIKFIDKYYSNIRLQLFIPFIQVLYAATIYHTIFASLCLSPSSLNRHAERRQEIGRFYIVILTILSHQLHRQ